MCKYKTVKEVKTTGCNIGKFHVLKSEDNDFGHIHLENENDAGTFFSKVRDGEFYVEGRPINFLASRQAGSKDPILYKIDETITSTIEPPTILNEPTTSEPSISIENFKEFGTERLVEFLRNDKNLSELKLDDSFFTKIMEKNITGRTFLKLTKSDLRECGLRLGPSLELEGYIQELGVKKKTLVMRCCAIMGSIVMTYKRFHCSETEKIGDDDKDFQYCMAEIKRKWKS
ncbi:hypothetical protein GLOIN_2v1482674 [Rhizophagus irregularis DAOM 181602=DAOM 197198]|nr:hypothetical protein GLOIN_2v1482674 [Rhizophagus irregularis DAOM 181602=DAOM 197198]